MTETRALIFVFIGIGLSTVATALVMAATDASGVVFGLVGTLLVSLGAFVASIVVMHYGRLKERKKREEIILSR
jgi:uncharacterized membrane protein YdjX (TVP38/TMEM64 family)